MKQWFKTRPLLPFAAILRQLPLKYGIFTLILWQLVVVIIAVGILVGCGLNKSAYSLLLGCLTCIIPTGCFAIKFFAYTGAQAARQIVRSFYRAELIKWLLTASLFALIFNFIPVQPLLFFMSFIGMQTSFWLIPLLQR